MKIVTRSYVLISVPLHNACRTGKNGEVSHLDQWINVASRDRALGVAPKDYKSEI